MSGTPERSPLSYSQEGIWLTQLLHPDSPRYTATAWVELPADVREEQVTAALRVVAARHETLRTTFAAAWEPPSQLVHEVGRHDVRVRECTEAELAAALGRAFPVSAAPPWQAYLTPTATGRMLSLLAHHLVTDDRSMELWIGELTALLAGTPADRLPPLEVQYADFTRWQRDWVAEPEQKALVEHWQAALAGVPASSGLPPDRPPAPDGPVSGSRSATVPAPAAGAVRAAAHAAGATGLMAWTALLAEVLGARSGQDRVPVGCVTEGRHLAEVAPLIGCFSAIVVFPTDVGGRPDLRTALERTRRVVLDALRTGELPFSVLVEKVNPAREPGTVPLAQVGIQMTDRPAAGAAAAGALGPATSSSPFDLELAVEEQADGTIRLTALHRTDLYGETTVAGLLDDLVALAQRAAADPDGPLRPPVAERPRPQRPDGRLDQLVAEQGRRRPGAVAVSCDDQQLTYEQLDRRVVAVHRSLDRAGVRPGDRVGVLLDRSVDLLPAILGCWRAGAVYVPLDPGYPPSRLGHMVRAGGLAVVLCDRELTATAEALGATALLVERPEGDQGGPPATPGGPGDAAYVMFTSGSTGVPKGVVVEHGSVVATLLAVAAEVGITEADVLLAVTPTSFDISVLELLLPLLVGARVEVASRASTRDGEALLGLARRCGATVLQATPATWRMLAAADPDRRLDVAVLCGGEAMPPDLARELRGRGRGQWNLYGPTEATIWASSWRLHEARDERVSIGRALASASLHVLDADLAPVPPGTAGELYIGGPCVARGYLGDPAATAAKFVGRGDDRLYRTGDLVRARPDGALDFLGRMDSQVKVRGHRIELTEVEATLRLHPQVADAVAAAVQDGSGEHQLVAYVLAAGAAPDRAALAGFLAERLPGYLVPTTFLAIEAVPLTPNGKVDRLALVASGAPRLGAAADAGRPGADRDAGTETERQVAAICADLICADLIGAGRVGPDDDFFAVGGHSLLMVQLLSRLRSTFSAPVPLRDLFDQPTVRGIAAAVDRHRPDAEAAAPQTPQLIRRSRT